MYLHPNVGVRKVTTVMGGKIRLVLPRSASWIAGTVPCELTRAVNYSGCGDQPNQPLYIMSEMGADKLPNNWSNQPTKIKLDSFDDYKPKIAGKRVLDIQCINKNCTRLFATKKEMLRHKRNDHWSKLMNTDDCELLSCPVEDFLKTFKTKGWLMRHISTCHPQQHNDPKVEIVTSHHKSSRYTTSENLRSAHFQTVLNNSQHGKE
ncbi:hypothetical protein MN116_004429 [Schistosoma mekongi]|uniref:C2H2-type domain-containing protein n=1 Tax=Schistosoma mekongi TaxID=38744 RepID=A0AAE2D6G9_SCHME|nr:hypothetical protein MN116_004429 [Schistosoma mekongi]